MLFPEAQADARFIVANKQLKVLETKVLRPSGEVTMVWNFLFKPWNLDLDLASPEAAMQKSGGTMDPYHAFKVDANPRRAHD